MAKRYPLPAQRLHSMVNLGNTFMSAQTFAPRSLETEIQFLKGIGPRLAPLFGKLGVKTVADLLFHVPRRYEDRRNIPPIRSVRPGQHATVRGELIEVSSATKGRGMVIIKATIADESGQINLTWFNQPWIGKKLREYKGEILAYGMVKEAHYGCEISSPEWETVGEEEEAEEFGKIVPVYALSEGIPQKTIRRAVRFALDQYLPLVRDPLTPPILKAQMLRPLRWSITQIHRPESDEFRAQARQRLVFEDFFYMQLALQMRRLQSHQEEGIGFPLAALDVPVLQEIEGMLPFDMTGAQKRVLGEILRDMESPHPMNRLVQGDVGSGKTAIAAAAMLAAVRCGYQAALMAPTEILAEQHYINLHRLFDPHGIKTVLMVGKLSTKDKRKAIDEAATGTAQIAIGTHALIQQGVSFHRLGLAIVDEQHRFGVMQRAALRQKGLTTPDVVVMTATPIPRTLTMTVFGDLDLSVIDELPPGRKSIKTHWKQANERGAIYSSIRSLIAEGQQAYFVCPMISESEKMQTQAAEDLFYRLSSIQYPGFRVGLLHGQMKPTEKEATMEAFRRHELDILVSTVVIEVGVDVPNAGIMVIEDAHRFGLTQLHQLRGRVGRSSQQSFCVLISDGRNEEARGRLEALVATNDGFRIAETDLRLRGPGEIAGTKQSGNLDFKVADLVQDGKMLEVARQAAIDLLKSDPNLELPEHAAILDRVLGQKGNRALVTVS